MKKRELFITSFDQKRLMAILQSPDYQTGRDKEQLLDLRNELEKAVIVEPGEIPPDIVTMNSKVKIRDMQSGELKEYILAYPNEADIAQNKISVLAPIGTALLGYREGDVIEWTVPNGKRVIKVESVLYQPESAGNFTR